MTNDPCVLQPTSQTRQITFKIIDDDELLEEQEEDENDPVVSFTVVDETQPDTFVSASSGLDDVPPTISSDPVFQEIVQSGATQDSEKSKRSRAYDPRHNAIYAHKYRDNYSNWYYFRRGY